MQVYSLLFSGFQAPVYVQFLRGCIAVASLLHRRRIAVASLSPRHIASLHEAHATIIPHLIRINLLHGEEVEPLQRALRGATMRALVC